MANNIDHAALKVELETDPVTMGYTGDNSHDADLINDPLGRPAVTGSQPGELFIYLGGEKARDHNADARTSIYGRLQRVHEAGLAYIGQKVFGTEPEHSVLTDDALDSCRTLLAIANEDLLADFVKNVSDAKFQNLLDDVISCGVMKQGDKDAIIALGNGTQSRGAEIDIGGRVRARDCEYARSL